MNSDSEIEKEIEIEKLQSEEDPESFRSFSLDEFSDEVSNSSGVESSNVKSVIQAFVEINLKNLKLR